MGSIWGQIQSSEEATVVPEREVREESVAERMSFPSETPLKLTGYVDGSYIYNFGPGTAASTLDFPADTCSKGDFNLNALWFRMEKPILRENRQAHAGFQFGLMLGEDATYYAAAGTTNIATGPNKIGRAHV